jgi:hypothetical protein
MREYELFLRLLAEKVYTAHGLRDASDFHAWLIECAEKAGRAATMQEFFAMLE